MKNILVTGASGNIGSRLIEHLRGKELNVKAGLRNIEKSKTIGGDNVELVEFDYDRPETFKNAFSGIDKLFIVPPMVPDFKQRFRAAIESAKKAGIKYIAKLSVSGADSTSENTFQKMHGEVEEIVRNSHIAHVTINPVEFYQNYSNFYSASIKNEGKIYLPQGKSVKSMIDVDDIAAAFAVVLTENGHEGKMYNAAAYDYTNPEIAEIFTKELGKPVEYIDVPEEAARNEMQNHNMPEWFINAMMQLHYAWKQGWMVAPHEDLFSLIKKNPKTFNEFVKENAGAFK
ncbi:MAG: SDR family oxidoreductase [Ignavibacteria bacterium]|nr:SDR family oxidoreductase [Ignavibacteria bacterium]